MIKSDLIPGKSSVLTGEQKYSDEFRNTCIQVEMYECDCISVVLQFSYN